MSLFYSHSSQQSNPSDPAEGFLASLSDRDALSRLLADNINRLLGIPKRLNLPEDGYLPPDIREHSVGSQKRQSLEHAMRQAVSSPQVQSQLSQQASTHREALNRMDLMFLDCP